MFKTRFGGQISNYLGMQINRNKDGCFELSQTDKGAQLLKIFGMQDAKEVHSPMAAGV